VLDPFAGSNTTGQVAEGLGRRWVSIEILPEYVEASRLRFQLPSAVRRSAVTGPGRVPPAG
jgi:site-specific DNA-methyltransferase (cytosine-N4-specific)